jgi:hypothetical protein
MIPLPHFFAWKLDLEPWVSLWSNYFGEESTPPLARTEGNKKPPRTAWKEGNKEYRSDQIHCGGGVRFGTWGVRECFAASPDGSQWAVTRR